MLKIYIGGIVILIIILLYSYKYKEGFIATCTKKVTTPAATFNSHSFTCAENEYLSQIQRKNVENAVNGNDKQYTYTCCTDPDMDGKMGPSGDVGAAGPAGDIGPPGEKGKQGEKGSLGPIGPVGPDGPMGPEGDQGPRGPSGPDEISGKKPPMKPIRGPKGPRGNRGPRGTEGPQGDVGPAYERPKPDESKFEQIQHRIADSVLFNKNRKSIPFAHQLKEEEEEEEEEEEDTPSRAQGKEFSKSTYKKSDTCS
jgi:hypothetical protein